MNQKIVGALGIALASAAAAPVHAASVTLNNWAYGTSANTVSVSTPNHTGPAGGFKGAVGFAVGGEGGFSGLLQNFITYCVEIDESFSFSGSPNHLYSVVAGASYAKWANANGNGKSAADTSMRLGQLMSYVAGNAGAVDTSAESTSMQLAVWNVIYDTDNTVAGGSFREKSGSSYNAYADTLLTASASWSQMLDVFVLSKAGRQDFVLTREGGGRVPARLLANDVPEPASLALAALALGAAGVASRRRKA